MGKRFSGKFGNTVTAVLIVWSTLAACSEEFPVKAVLFPFREAVIAARIDSTLESCAFRPGEAFAAKAVLAKLDDRRFRIEAERLEEQCRFAKTVYEDQKRLHEKNFTSDFELRRREFELRAAESGLAEARLNLSYCTIEAPFPGRIEEIVTREYETVRAGQPLLKIIDDHQLLAVMNIPVGELSNYRIGTEIAVALPENNLIARGRVYEVMPRADHRSGTIRIKALIDNRNGLYTAGMTGTLVRKQ